MSVRSWSLENAHERAQRSSKSFQIPGENSIKKLELGNYAKLIFKVTSRESGRPEAEFLWVRITRVDGDYFTGLLVTHPECIHDLHLNDSVDFNTGHIIATDFDAPGFSSVDKYSKRCFVTKKVLEAGEAVGYLYREAGETSDDSGWRITTGTESEEYMSDDQNVVYVSLSTVLNVDDSILPLLEFEANVAFIRTDQGDFVPLDVE